MRRDEVDFFAIEAGHIPMHIRLENWARYVDARGIRWNQAAIWKMGKSNGRQWETPALRPAVDTLDGHALEKAVGALPEKNRDALRWCYCYRGGALHAARRLAVTRAGLYELVRMGRAMLINRKV